MNKKYFLIFIFFTFRILSQDFNKSILSSSVNDMKDKMKSNNKIKNNSQNAFDGVINPLAYYIGPNDEFEINIWTNESLTYNLNVTPEGTIIIPTVGEVKVADLLLADAKKKIIESIKKKYISNDISVTLVNVRDITVTILGSVLNPGKYIVKSNQRVDEVLQLANDVNEKIDKEFDYNAFNEKQSKRNIVINSKNNKKLIVDLQKFQALKNDSLNPYLREGDVIIIPEMDLKRNLIGIYGEVNNPGKFEFKENEKLSDLVLLGQGFTELADLSKLEFTRLDKSGNKIEKKYLNGKDILNKINDFNLEQGDILVVKKKIDLRENYIVEVKGEVLNPGFYPTTKNGIFLSEIIKAAGGLTDIAFLEGAEIIRSSITKKESELEKLLSSRNYVIIEDSMYYNIESEIRLQKEIVTADFKKILIDGDKNSDVLIKSGDIINIPNNLHTIYVFGQVVNPGYINFEKNKKIEYYILKAGNFTSEARESDIRIIKAKTKQWLEVDETTIEDGDMIWVPKKIKYQFKEITTITAQIASILSVIVTSLILLK